MNAGQGTSVLKEDALGRVERLDAVGRAVEGGGDGGGDARTPCVRRVACGGRIPGSQLVARLLMARERRALAALADLHGVPHLIDDRALAARASPGRPTPRAQEVLLRTWIGGDALHEASALPLDFFDHLDRLVASLHARGVCHNDLHKEQNIIVGLDGFPWLVDFQLASVHRKRSRVFESRVRDDLRHIEKHRRRYTLAGRAPALLENSRGSGHGLRRSWAALVWRRSIKPLYNALTRGLFGVRDGEARRASSGPWPRWTAALGTRPQSERGASRERGCAGA